MTRPLTREQCRELDRRATQTYGVPGVVLMENAGAAISRLLLSLGVTGEVAVCCGKGNNGGDGFVIARHLDNAGVPVRVLLFADPERLGGDAAVMFDILRRSGVPVEPWPDLARLGGAEWVVDALFGTGLTRPVEPPLDGVIAAINAAGAKVLAVDLPSGLDADTGEPLGACVRADHTATVAAPKAGFEAGAAWVGRVHVIDMGAPRAALRAACPGVGTSAY
ncbi:MAG: NAD(P)H-hydrate epimerase [Gemmataceae bacterium]